MTEISLCCCAGVYEAPEYYSTNMDAPIIKVCLKCGKKCDCIKVKKAG